MQHLKILVGEVLNNMISNESRIRGALLGVVVGDALGVPVEFMTREEIASDPVESMRGFGTFNLPPGSWSDDSSMTLCLTEALVGGYDLNKIASNFLAWMYEAKWTPYGKVFDIGNATAMAMQMLKRGFSPEKSGSVEISNNGNGSLMRTIPLLWEIIDKDIDTRYQITKEVSSITHAHIRSVLSCFYYLEFARGLYKGLTIDESWVFANNSFLDKVNREKIKVSEARNFARFLMDDFVNIPRDEINSMGYVMHTIEASIWCLMTTDNYKDAVLKAVNLGGDTDTTAAVTGGLAGLAYGLEGIPEVWVNQLARLEDINKLVDQFCEKYDGRREPTCVGDQPDPEDKA